MREIQSATGSLAEYFASVTFDELPEDVVSKAQQCLLDSLGCMIGGSQVQEVRTGVDLVLEWGCRPEARVPGLNGSFPVPSTAYAAAQLANALDYDDTVLGVGHPGASVIATALALGQLQGSSGQELIKSIVVGYESAIRIGRAMKPSEHRAQTVRGHTWSVFGSVAAAGSLLGLTSEQFRYAFGFAAQHAPVPFVGKWYERPITEIKNNYGWAAMGGVISAFLAARGATGNRNVLDGDTGFWAMASSDQWTAETVTEKLGTDYSVLDVEFKPFAACRYTHSAIDAMKTIISKHDFDSASVSKVTVRAGKRAQVFADYTPETLLHAQFSLPYALSSTVLGRPLTVFDPGDSAVSELAAKVEIETDDGAELQSSLSKLPAEVEVELLDGRRHTARTDVPPGVPSRALTMSDLAEKFLTLSAPVIGSDSADDLCRLTCGPVASLTIDELAGKSSLGQT